MAQNTSHAVMAQRHEPHKSLDYFPTPPWATRALCEELLWLHQPLSAMRVWEPACGEGHMARPLGEYFNSVVASDVHPYGYGTVVDFLWPGDVVGGAIEWVITNPPFRLAEQFIQTAKKRAEIGYAMLVRTSFLEGMQRHKHLFAKSPPAFVFQFAERVPMFRGRISAEGSTATSYCWLVWIKGQTDTRMRWIAPCRKRLEKPADYEVAA